MKIRHIPLHYPALVFKEADRRFEDSYLRTFIAVKRLNYSGKVRPIAVAYIASGDAVKLLTIFPISENNMMNRIRNKRWIPVD